jgi:GxxExxY protein
VTRRQKGGVGRRPLAGDWDRAAPSRRKHFMEQSECLRAGAPLDPVRASADPPHPPCLRVFAAIVPPSLSLSIAVLSYFVIASHCKSSTIATSFAADCSIDRGGPALALIDRMLVDGTFTATTHEILAAAIEVHKTLGPGLLESTYSQCLLFELSTRKLRFVTQHSIPLVYKGVAFDSSYRVDLIVEGCVVVEVKSVTAILPVHRAQLLTYMKLTECPAGLLINFNEARLMDGVKRLLNTRPAGN